MFAEGSTIGGYQIVARLRAGGMATLFLGRRTGVAGFSRLVAIKVVHPHLASNPAFVRMLVDEALLASRIDHPNVVHVEELGRADGTYFVAMEFVHGISVAQLTRKLVAAKRRLAPECAVAIAAHVAEGLHAAHETVGDDRQSLGVVHRDVSPQNILISYGGHVKLIDFGVAKVRGRDTGTRAGSLRGKIRYMPPEQAYGRPVDRRADVYALGIVLWEMLTMKRPFSAESEMGLLDEVREPKIPPPSTWSPELPEALDRAVMLALSPDIAARPATAQIFRKMLLEAMPAANRFGASDIEALIAEVDPGGSEAATQVLPPEASRALEIARSENSRAGTAPGEQEAAPAPVRADASKGFTVSAADREMDVVDDSHTEVSDDLAADAAVSSFARSRGVSRSATVMTALGSVFVGAALWLGIARRGPVATATSFTPSREARTSPDDARPLAPAIADASATARAVEVEPGASADAGAIATASPTTDLPTRDSHARGHNRGHSSRTRLLDGVPIVERVRF